jgi:hypothetical protein
VKKHIGHILEKLGLQDRLQAGLYIARNPLLVAREPAADRTARENLRRAHRTGPRPR